MTKAEIKTLISNKLIKLMGEWFEGKPLYQALGITIVQTNINKFDGLIDMLTDENGNVKADLLIDNLGDALEQDMTIDLTTISPLLPQRILIITKQDIQEIVAEIRKGALISPLFQ